MDDIFAPEDNLDYSEPKHGDSHNWNILVVDDEEDVHAITHLSLSDFQYNKKSVFLLNAKSGEEAKEILNQRDDIALILLDVVMETANAGLELVKYIRNDLKNSIVRIILRTGQPGVAPENEVVKNYDINDYQTKADLTENRLYTIVTSSLRAYESLITIDNYNRRLEQMVEERTEEVKRKSNEIIESIKYASRIQGALLPSEEYLETTLNNYFVYYQPLNIVSGDFYWVKQIENITIIAVADCTGHGVPGAFMSILGIAFLNELITHRKHVTAAGYLTELRELIKKSLNQTGKDCEVVDGMDMTLVIIDKNQYKMHFAGANNKILILKNNKSSATEIIEYKGDRMPVGIHIKEKSNFTNQEINIHKGDNLYMFSDGIIDQFGGENNKKFSLSQLKQILNEIQFLPMENQKRFIIEKFQNWKNNYYQIDDVLLMGIHIS
ncbi:MAG: SpoIIE family protein phosphatase [Bacteroidales bacterium]|nr:SpoIIE family protein phosphatase [Bacteroidales bacterium]